jgi:hypothetical protein
LAVADQQPAVVLGAGGREPELPSDPSRRGDVVTADLTEFLNARLDEDEAAAQNRTCIHCGARTVPLRSVIGITGYTHDSWDPETETRSGWEGGRCRNRLTGAEPVQDPARALREVAAKRAIIATVFAYEAKIDGEWACCHSAKEIAIGQCPETRPDDITALRELAAIWSDHPDYQDGWAS